MLTRVSAVPYRNANRPGALYRGDEILEDMKAILSEFKPTKVFVSHPADGHRDHRAFYLFTQVALWELKIHPEIFPYLIHHPRWPEPRGFVAGRVLTPPASFHQMAWASRTLTSEQIDGKRLAIEAHRTQMAKDHAYLLSFVAQNELFGDFPPIALPEQSAAHIAPQELPRIAPGEEANPSLDLAWRHLERQGDALILHMTFSKPVFFSNENAVLYLFGFRQDKPFGQMPKIRIVIHPRSIRVFDQQTARPDHGIRVAREASAITLTIPLSLLGAPEKIIGTAWSRTIEDASDWRSWRVIELEPAPDGPVGPAPGFGESR
jgi:hypothetical protein